MARLMHQGRWLCLAGAAIGFCGLAAWTWGLGPSTAILPGQPPMMPNTALGLLLLGVGAALRAPEIQGRAPKVVSTLLALSVLVLGLVTLAEYLLRVDLLIDRLVIVAEAGPHPGRPSPVTALALSLLSSGLAIFDVRPTSRFRPSEWLILLGGLAAFTALVGFAFGTGPLYRLMRTPVIGVALPTAVALLFLSVGLLLERPGGGLMQLATSPDPGGVLLRRLVVPALLTPPLLGVAVTRLSPVFGLGEPSFEVAVLAATTAVASLFFLGAAAVPLNRAQIALQESRARSRELVELAPDGVFLADIEGRYVDVNRAGCRMLGYTRDELVGKTIVELLPPEEVERLWQSKELLLKGEPHVAEWNLRRKDGSYLPVEVSAAILQDGRWQAFVRDIRERKRAQEQLRQAQERFELALEGADLAIWDWRIHSGEVSFNARWAELRGYRPEEAHGHVDWWMEGVHPDDLPRVKAQLDAYLRGEIPEYEAELRVRTKTGAWVWILDRGKVFARNERGEPTRMTGTELDITARKNAEAALRLAEAKSSGILAISSDAIISTGLDQRITMFNEGAERIFGYAKAEVMGAPIEMLVPERHRALHRQQIERFAGGPEVARTMGQRGAAICGRRKNGEEFPADAAISRLAVGDTTILTVTLRDITEQKRLEREQRFLAEIGPLLSASLDYEETLSRVAQAASRELADICIVDLVEETGQLRRVAIATRDPEARWIGDVLRRSTEMPPGPMFEAVFEGKESILVQEVTDTVLEVWARSREELDALRAARPASIIAAPLLARDRLLGLVKLVSCTPTRRYGQPELRLAEELARRAALAIDNARHYHAAKRAVRERDDVLAVVAHDLRNPLGVILMQAGKLRRRGLEGPPGSIRSAEAIERAASRMNSLINDLLDITRLEAGRLSIEPRRLPPAELVAEALEAQKAQAASAACALAAELPADLPEVWADRDRLLQVLENLVGNALKFTGPGGRITAGAAFRDGEVLFWIADTGPGIPAEDVPNLFDRFWQARKADRRGAGLGLPIVKGIVEAHHGRVWVASTPGRGSTFFFTLPAAPRPAEQPEPPPAGPS